MTLAQTALADLEQELASTRRILEHLPEERFDFRLHERAWTLGELASHVARVPWWGVMTMQGDSHDLGEDPRPESAFESKEALLAAWDAHAGDLVVRVNAATDEAMQEPWTLRAGERTFFTMPRLPILRSFVVNHLIHHRGQLTVYLRLLGVPVPSTYGGTADEQVF